MDMDIDTDINIHLDIDIGIDIDTDIHGSVHLMSGLSTGGAYQMFQLHNGTPR